MSDVLNPVDLGLPSDFTLSTGTNGHTRSLKFLIIGGCGYFGWRLAQTLHRLGAHVRLLDLRLPQNIQKHTDSRLEFVKGDICHYQSVRTACLGMDCVYHVASYGLSGKDQLDKHMNEVVNVQGTKHVIQACKEVGVTRLVYTSSYNVVMNGRPIENGTEDLPYGNPDTMVDYYSKTKCQADQLITQANGSEVAGGSRLFTCCLRPPGIFGPGETRHLDRAAAIIEMNLIVATIGDATVDWVHVNNLIQAHLLAVLALSPARNSVAAGKCYFISDNEPVKFFEFLKPLISALGHQQPIFKIHYLVVYYAAFLMELVYLLMKPWMTLEPLATRTEVLKMGMTHYHKMDRAMDELGYRPARYDFKQVVKQYLRDRQEQSGDVTSSRFWTKIVIVGVLLACCLIQLLL